MTNRSRRQHTQTDYAVAEIRQRILNGGYQQGMRLRQQSVAKELQIGITPVREAFLVLASEGLLERSPYRGVVVADMTIDVVRDIYAVRRLLEGYAARLACSHASLEDLAKIEDLLTQMQGRDLLLNDAEYQRLNQAFHEAVYMCSANRVLISEIQAMWKRFPRDTFGLLPHRRAQSLADHTQIMGALRRQDGALTEALMVAHIAGAEYDIVTYLEEQQSLHAERGEK